MNTLETQRETAEPQGKHEREGHVDIYNMVPESIERVQVKPFLHVNSGHLETIKAYFYRTEDHLKLNPELLECNIQELVIN